MSGSSFSGRHHSYASASSELDDSEVARRFSDVIAQAQTAFQTDPSYVVEMTSSATSIVDRRETTSARREALYEQDAATLQEAIAAVRQRRSRS